MCTAWCGRLPETLQLLLAWIALSILATARWPIWGGQIAATLLPSSDIALALLLLAFLIWGGVRVHARAIATLALAAVFTRGYLIADAISEHYTGRPFHLSSDLELIPELLRLLRPITGGFGLTVLLLALGGSFWLLYRAARWLLRLACAALARSLPRRSLVGAAALLVAGSVAGARAYSPPVTPRVFAEVRDLLVTKGLYDDGSVQQRRDALKRRIEDTERELTRASLDLTPQRALDVHVILIEAYGEIVYSKPEFLERLRRQLRGAEQSLASAGFHVCSDVLTAPTFGGGSWLTHATLESGVRIADQFDYDTLLGMPRVPTLARMFSQAGYRTVSVKPGTTRDSPHTTFYGFDIEYDARHLGYAGPRHAWSPMPDQYVLEAVRQRELVQRGPRPLFIEYALVSSHYPFQPLPPYLEDRARLGDGAIFGRAAVQNVPPPSDGVSEVASAYLSAIDYELRVVVDFVTTALRRPGLVLLLGDHQPTAGVADPSASWAVPIHVLSQDAALLRTWIAGGCSEGLIAQQTTARRGIESLLPRLAADLGLRLPEAR